MNSKYVPYSVVQTDKIPDNLNEYLFFAGRETSLTREEIWISWIVDNGLEGFIDLPNKNIYDYYVHEKSFLEALKKLADYMFDDWEGHLRRYSKFKDELIVSSQKVSDSIETKNKEMILKSYETYIKTAYRYSEFIWSPWAMVFHYEKDLAEKYPDKMELITSLDAPIEHINMLSDLHILQPDKMEERYSWLNIYSSYDKPYTSKDFIKLKRESSIENIKSQFENYKKIKSDFENFLDTITNKEIKQKAVMVHKYAWLKTDRIDTWKRSMFNLIPFFEYLSEGLNISLKNSTFLSTKDIIDYLKNNTKPEISLIKNRTAHHSLFLFHNKKIEEIAEKSMIRQIHSTFISRIRSEKELKGMVACKGKAKGKVKVINHSNELGKIEDGDIFVAKYTFPSYTPAMLRSAAIITDEGGLVTHAAILSREYDIPCIIGTKIATQVLKDGDLVEVDAENGIVRKI